MSKRMLKKSVSSSWDDYNLDHSANFWEKCRLAELLIKSFQGDFS